MFEPLVEVYRFVVALLHPRQFKLRRPKLHFLTIHYMYIVAMTIIGSIMLYPAGLMSYTDALFFSAGMATQSGLNTININDLHTYQQVVMMLLTCPCTPIFINMVVVFVRLYWFEQKFEHIVAEVRSQRRTGTTSLASRSRSQMRDDLHDIEPQRLEAGVNGREITVLHNTTKPNGMTGGTSTTKDAEHEFVEKMVLDPADTSSSSLSGESHTNLGGSKDLHSGGNDVATEDATEARSVDHPTTSSVQPDNMPSEAALRPHRGITFADEVDPLDSSHPLELASVPVHRDISKHIDFLQRQQSDAKKGGALRIPGPRDFDRGEVPQQLDDNALDHRRLSRLLSPAHSISEHRDAVSRHSEDPVDNNLTVRRGITIDEPDHPAHHSHDHDSQSDTNSVSKLSRIMTGLTNRRHTRGLNLGEGSRSFAQTLNSFATSRTKEKIEDPYPYLSWQATIGRNSAFVGLNEQQREELGGIEYRSLKTLAVVLMVYFFGFHILGLMVFTPWIIYTQPWKGVVLDAGQSPAWWGIFTPASMFNDLGFTLTPDSMNSFEGAVLALLFGSFLIVIGNTGFPCMLRFMIWSLSKIVPYGGGLWEELRFLLDHPRRCFTLLFPSRATWWLFWVLILLNGIDLIFFIILDLNDPVVTVLPAGLRVLNGWFQAVSTRTAGFSCVNLAGLHPAIQVSYLIMMYISVFPIAISVRRTNVYEEKSLGIFKGAEQDGEEEGAGNSYVGQHLRRQLSFDLWYIFLGLFIIAIVEGDRLADTSDYGFTIFSVLFEIVSAYGTVGLSLGYPGIDASLSAEFRTLSKLVIIAMMIRGRHRGLPYALDRAILLPGEKRQQEIRAEADRLHAERTASRAHSIGASATADQDHQGRASWHSGDAAPHNMSTSQLSRRATSRDPRQNGDDDEQAQVNLRERRSGVSLRPARHEPRHSLSRVLAGTLTAGPTLSRE